MKIKLLLIAAMIFLSSPAFCWTEDSLNDFEDYFNTVLSLEQYYGNFSKTDLRIKVIYACNLRSSAGICAIKPDHSRILYKKKNARGDECIFYTALVAVNHDEGREVYRGNVLQIEKVATAPVVGVCDVEPIPFYRVAEEVWEQIK